MFTRNKFMSQLRLMGGFLIMMKMYINKYIYKVYCVKSLFSFCQLSFSQQRFFVIFQFLNFQKNYSIQNDLLQMVYLGGKAILFLSAMYLRL